MSTAGHSLGDENEGAALACALAPAHVARPRAAQVRQRVGAAAVLQRARAAWFVHAAAVQLARHVMNALRESRLRAQLGEHLRYAQGWRRAGVRFESAFRAQAERLSLQAGVRTLRFTHGKRSGWCRVVCAAECRLGARTYLVLAPLAVELQQVHRAEAEAVDDVLERRGRDRVPVGGGVGRLGNIYLLGLSSTSSLVVAVGVSRSLV